MHIALIVSISLVLAYLVSVLLVRRGRGETAFVRRAIPLTIGLALLLVGTVLRGGPHDGAGDLLMAAGVVTELAGALRLATWQKQNRPAA